MAIYVNGWTRDSRLQLLLPDGARAALEGESRDDPVVVFVEAGEALRSWRPWPAEDEGAAQRAAHERAAGGGPCRGYASWLSAGPPDATPLLLRESSASQIWTAGWLHRRWALDNGALFPRECAVLELGAGAGLLGLSVAAAFGASVTLSDRGGGDDGTGGEEAGALRTLRENAAANASLIEARGGRVRVVEADWARPSSPREWPLDVASCAATTAVSSDSMVADAILATEVLYTARGTARFVEAVARWLRKPAGGSPGGVLYLVNNARRTGVDGFAASCAAHGLRVEHLPSLEPSDDGRVLSAFAPPWDDSALYCFMHVTWAPEGG